MQEPTHVGFGDNVLTDMIGKIVAEPCEIRCTHIEWQRLLAIPSHMYKRSSLIPAHTKTQTPHRREAYLVKGNAECSSARLCQVEHCLHVRRGW